MKITKKIQSINYEKNFFKFDNKINFFLKQKIKILNKYILTSLLKKNNKRVCKKILIHIFHIILFHLF